MTSPCVDKMVVEKFTRVLVIVQFDRVDCISFIFCHSVLALAQRATAYL